MLAKLNTQWLVVTTVNTASLLQTTKKSALLNGNEPSWRLSHSAHIFKLQRGLLNLNLVFEQVWSWEGKRKVGSKIDFYKILFWDSLNEKIVEVLALNGSWLWKAGSYCQTRRLFDWPTENQPKPQLNTQVEKVCGGGIARASHPAAPGSMPSVPKKFSEEKLSMLLRLINGAG